ncbi:MAG TPA: ABC transporter ATP-binding protein, partial [Acidimicrobiia bacterium]|nr:ABC transporter ATP-binding protein [Acidimicrobiia bacterium]
MRGGGGGPFGQHAIEETLTRHEARQVLRRLAQVLRPYRWRIAFSILLLIGQTSCLLAGPALVRHGIDDGLRAHDAGALNLSAFIYLIAAIAGLFFGRAVIKVVARIGESFLRDLRAGVFRHLMSLGMDFFEREKTGTLVARMTSDMDALQELVQMGLVMFVQNGLLFAGAIIVIFLMSWQLALCTLVVVPPVVIASRWFRRASNKAYLLVRDRIGQNLSTLQEGLAGIRVVQAFGRERAFTRRFQETNEAQYDANIETVRISAKYFPIVEFAGVAGVALIVGVGGAFVSADIVTI